MTALDSSGADSSATGSYQRRGFGIDVAASR